MSVSGYPTLWRLCKSSSSTHSGGTWAARATVMRSRSCASSPLAIAMATRTKATVLASNVPFPAPGSLILLLLQSPIYPQLSHLVAPGIDVGPHSERFRLRLDPQVGQHCRNRQRRGGAVAVFDLERDPQPLGHDQRAVHALGADLGEHAAGMGAHQVGAGAPGRLGRPAMVARQCQSPGVRA